MSDGLPAQLNLFLQTMTYARTHKSNKHKSDLLYRVRIYLLHQKIKLTTLLNVHGKYKTISRIRLVNKPVAAIKGSMRTPRRLGRFATKELNNK